ncbi:MAG: thioredoxin [Halobacteriaceae archaeon]
MSESDDLDAIRERRKQELMQQGDDGSDGQSEPETASTPDDPVHVDGAGELDEVTAKYDVVLVDFYADWCGPCKMLEPIVAEIAATTDAVVAKVDVDRNQRLAQQYRVQGVPTMVLFSDGEAVQQMVGVQDQSTLLDHIERAQSA